MSFAGPCPITRERIISTDVTSSAIFDVIGARKIWITSGELT